MCFLPGPDLDLGHTSLAFGAKISVMNPHTIKVACSNCNLRELCMPMDLSTEELDRIDAVVGARRRV